MALAFSQEANSTLYAIVGPDGDIYASIDGAQNWAYIGNNPELCCNFGRRLFVSPMNGKVLFGTSIPTTISILPQTPTPPPPIPLKENYFLELIGIYFGTFSLIGFVKSMKVYKLLLPIIFMVGIIYFILGIYYLNGMGIKSFIFSALGIVLICIGLDKLRKFKTDFRKK